MSFVEPHTTDVTEDFSRTLAAYEAFRPRDLMLDMTRGKPSPEQLDLSSALLRLPDQDHLTAAGEDVRNYGGLQGLPEARALFAGVLGAPPAQVVVGNNSSLALMHDCLSYALSKGVPGGRSPWAKQEPIAFLCPVPGYDRHFALCETYGVEMRPVPLTGEGPDLDTVEALVADPAVKGMWCVPSTPTPQARLFQIGWSSAWPRCIPQLRISDCSGTTPMPSTTCPSVRTRSRTFLGLVIGPAIPTGRLFLPRPRRSRLPDPALRFWPHR